MEKTIDMTKVERIWAAEKELRAAIEDAGMVNILATIECHRYPLGYDLIHVSVQQRISPLE